MDYQRRYMMYSIGKLTRFLLIDSAELRLYLGYIFAKFALDFVGLSA